MYIHVYLHIQYTLHIHYNLHSTLFKFRILSCIVTYFIFIKIILKSMHFFPPAHSLADTSGELLWVCNARRRSWVYSPVELNILSAFYLGPILSSVRSFIFLCFLLPVQFARHLRIFLDFNSYT
uniref:Uncharacterized protein n=1 Tax=Cacopsylla melanoneura TaxID=428564 RepID=A0A8D8TKL3_9HEMI